jgi:flagellar basal body rod protein FlgG
MQSLWTGLTGLSSASGWLDRVSNNLANTSTVGFASDTASFADTYTEALQGSATAPDVSGRYTPLGWWGGSGVMTTGDTKDFDTALPTSTTGNTMDASISGPGYFEVRGDSGTYLTKAGNFTWSKQPDGTFALAMPNGMPVLDTNGQVITEPETQSSTGNSVGAGTQSGTQPSGNSALTIGQDGQIQFGNTKGPKLAIVDVADADVSLQPVSDNLYAVKAGYRMTPSTTSTVNQGSLSMSNVDLTKQMTDMIQAQQMYNLNAESISMTNKMMGIANAIRG